MPSYFWPLYSLVSAAALLVGASGRSPHFYIPDDYNKNEAPNSDNDTGPVQVGISFAIIQLTNIDDLSDQVSMDVAITRTWSDGRLIFNSTSSRKEGRLLLGSGDASKLWKPDLYVSNMRELNTIQYGGLDTTYLMVNGDKSVTQVLRAILVVNCNFKFNMYPMDIQSCKIDFTSPYNPVEELVNTWLAEGPETDAVYFGKDEQSSSNTLRLPNYQAYISYCGESLVTSYVWGNSSTLRLYLTLDRELTPHLLETYLPTGLFVIISWGSFTVKPENVPGRMVLLVTNLLSLVTLFESVRNNSPAAMGIKCMDVWLVACILFIFLALVEYIAVLWKIRGPFFERKTSFIQNSDTPITYKNTKRIEATNEKVSYMCEFLRKCRKMLQYVYQTRPTSMWDPLDKISVFVFPFMFLICNTVYWPTYIIMRSQLDLPSVCTDE